MGDAHGVRSFGVVRVSTCFVSIRVETTNADILMERGQLLRSVVIMSWKRIVPNIAETQ